MKTTARFVSAAAFAAVLLGACGGHDDPTSVSEGRLVVRLTDAAALTDSLKSVDVFVVRIDARLAATSDADAASNVDEPARGGWIALATPNASFNLLALRDRVSSPLGDMAVRPAAYAGFRIIIDPSKSSVTLKSGRVLTGSSSPGILFPSASRIGIRIVPSRPVVVVGGERTTLIIDFDAGASFIQRGTSVERNGLLFRPVIQATIIDAGTISATVRFINLSRSSINLQQDGNGITRLDVDQVSGCLVLSAPQPVFASQVGSNTLATRFGPELVPGLSYVVVALDGRGEEPRFVTLANTFTPASGQAGLRVLNVTGLASGLDVFLRAEAPAAGLVKLASVLGDSASAFINVPAGLALIRLTNANETSVLLDVDAQRFRAGQRVTLVILPLLVGLRALRFFIFEGC